MANTKSLIVPSTSQSPKPTKVIITSNVDANKKPDLIGGFAFLEYHENIFADTNRISYAFVDTGIQGQTIKESLPLYNSEDIEFEFADNNGVKLKPKFVVNQNITTEQTATTSTILLKCVSEEILRNECEESICNDSYQGTISDHVKNILKNNLKSQKNIDAENGSTYNFNGNRHKSLYTLNWLSKHDTPSKKGDTAGFLFFETSEGYKYKSIDFLFNQKPKKRFIMNDSTEVPQPYDGKILDIFLADQSDATTKLRSGVVVNELITFNPRERKFGKDKKELRSNVESGRDFAKFNKKFLSSITRTTFAMTDTGSQNTNGSTKQQVQKNNESNFDVQSILNQSIKRYNEIDSQKTSITIAGDFELHVGDTIFIDVRSLSDQIDNLDKFIGGKYLITDLCHRMDSTGVFTKLNLQRDKFKRGSVNRGPL